MLHRRFLLMLAALVFPALAFPAVTALLLALDTVAGDQLALYQLRYESRRLFALGVLADWGRALPLFYMMHVGVLWPASAALAIRRRGGFWLLPAAGAALGVVVTVYLTGAFPLMTVIVMALAGGMLASAYGWIIFGLYKR